MAKKKHLFAEILSSMYCHDTITIAFLGIFAVMAVLWSASFPGWVGIVLRNVLMITGITLVALYDRRTHNTILDILHRFYIVAITFIIFKEVYDLLPAVHPGLYDNYLIGIDRAIFTVDPTRWLAQFSSPVAVEYLQICYSLFYFLMIGLTVETVVRKQNANYEQVVTYLAYGFYLSYIGYFLFPAIGPRFTLHDFAQLNNELPGMWLTNFLRDIINRGESIGPGTTNFFAMAQRDAFPSGHTEMTLITIALVWRYRAAIRWWVTVIGVSLILSTVYLRYHYVIDVIGGVIFFLLTMWTAPHIERWWSRTVANANARLNAS